MSAYPLAQPIGGSVAHRGTGNGIDHALAERALASQRGREQAAMQRPPLSFVRTLCECRDPECREYQLRQDRKAAAQVAEKEPSEKAFEHVYLTNLAWFIERRACVTRCRALQKVEKQTDNEAGQ